MSGVETIEQLALLAPASCVLVLTNSEQNQVVEAIIAGANGYILRTAPPEESSPLSSPPQQAKACSPPKSPGN
jgi:DNA-binding NarL/FixJ family response regulator